MSIDQTPLHGEWHHHDDRDALAEALAGVLADALRAATAARGTASAVLAGGGTPLPAYRALAGARLDWPAVTALPSDERWVAHAHPACNLAQLRGCLAAAQGLDLRALTPATPGPDPDTAEAERSLATLAFRDFDVVLLGMGGDGHVASLFPGTDALSAAAVAADAPATRVVRPDPLPTEAPFARISLSLPRLLRTRRLLLAVTGEAKRSLLEQVLSGARAELPVARLLAASAVPAEIHWSP